MPLPRVIEKLQIFKLTHCILLAKNYFLLFSPDISLINLIMERDWDFSNCEFYKKRKGKRIEVNICY